MKHVRMMPLVVGVILALMVASVSAQEATPETVVAVTAADISGDPVGFNDTTVSLQGTVVEFVSPNAFVFTDDSIGEGMTPLLVINNSGQPLPNLLLRGGPVSLVGRVVPSNQAVTEGVSQPLDSFYTTRMEALVTSGASDTQPNDAGTGAQPQGDIQATAQATNDPSLPTPDAVAGGQVDPSVAELNPPEGAIQLMPYQEDMMNWLYTILPADYAGYPVIELTDLNLMVIPIEEAVG